VNEPVRVVALFVSRGIGLGYDFSVFVCSASFFGIVFCFDIALFELIGLVFGFCGGNTLSIIELVDHLFAFLSSLLIFLSITFHSSQGIR
jgi:hypothetical protein